MSEVTVGEIVDLVGGKYSGARDKVISGVAPLTDAGSSHLSFLSNPKYAEQAETTGAAVVLVANEHKGDSPRFIRVRNPYFAMATVVARFFAHRPAPKGVSHLAFVSLSAKLGENVCIGSFTTIGDDVVIGNDVVIYQNVSIEAGSVIGDGTIIYPVVSIYERTRIGKRCIIHSGAVIGADGYGFVMEGGRHHKIPQIGIVRIEDDVEVGAGSCIDRGALGETVIGEGTKLDNLVQIGHNVKTGRHCLFVSGTGIAGSTEVGDYVVVAGQGGFGGHLKIGNGVQVAARSALLHDAESGKFMGTPAIPFREFARREVLLRKLPDLFARVEQLEKKKKRVKKS